MIALYKNIITLSRVLPPKLLINSVITLCYKSYDSCVSKLFQLYILYYFPFLWRNDNAKKSIRFLLEVDNYVIFILVVSKHSATDSINFNALSFEFWQTFLHQLQINLALFHIYFQVTTQF